MNSPVEDLDYGQLKRDVRAFGMSPAERQMYYPILPLLVSRSAALTGKTPAAIMSACESRFRSVLTNFALKQHGLTALELHAVLMQESQHRGLCQLLAHACRLSAAQMQLLTPFVHCVAAATAPRVELAFCICQDAVQQQQQQQQQRRPSDDAADAPPAFYLVPTFAEHYVRQVSFRRCLQRRLPATFQTLSALGALSDPHLAHFFVGLFFSVLPETQARHVVDMYMVEGEKVLFRFGLALFALHKREIKAGELGSTGAQLWQYLTSAAARQRHGQQFDALCRLAFLGPGAACLPRSLLGGLGSRSWALSRSALAAVKEDVRVTFAGSMRTVDLEAHLLPSVQTVVGLSTWYRASVFPSACRILHDDATLALAVRLQSHLDTLAPSSGSVAGAGGGNAVGANVNATTFVLAFSSASHGFGIKTLFQRVAFRDGPPCILLLRTLRTRAVVGVYLCEDPAYGQPCSFCFRLDDGDDGTRAAVYLGGTSGSSLLAAGAGGGRQAGMAGGQAGGGAAGVDGAGGARKDGFAVCSEFSLAFGSSDQRQPSSAIRLERELHMASTGPSTTYDNPDMVPLEPSPFAVDLIEVLVCSRAEERVGDGPQDQPNSSPEPPMLELELEGEEDDGREFAPLTTANLGLADGAYQHLVDERRQGGSPLPLLHQRPMQMQQRPQPTAQQQQLQEQLRQWEEQASRQRERQQQQQQQRPLPSSLLASRPLAAIPLPPTSPSSPSSPRSHAPGSATRPPPAPASAPAPAPAPLSALHLTLGDARDDDSDADADADAGAGAGADSDSASASSAGVGGGRAGSRPSPASSLGRASGSVSSDEGGGGGGGGGGMGRGDEFEL